MIVTEQRHLSLFNEITHELLGVINSRMEVFIGNDPFAV